MQGGGARTLVPVGVGDVKGRDPEWEARPAQRVTGAEASLPTASQERYRHRAAAYVALPGG